MVPGDKEVCMLGSKINNSRDGFVIADFTASNQKSNINNKQSM